METVIRMRLSELNDASIEKLKFIVRQSSGQDDPEFAILIHDNAHDRYLKDLTTSIEQLEKGETVSFTMAEFSESVNNSI